MNLTSSLFRPWDVVIANWIHTILFFSHLWCIKEKRIWWFFFVGIRLYSTNEREIQKVLHLTYNDKNTIREWKIGEKEFTLSLKANYLCSVSVQGMLNLIIKSNKRNIPQNFHRHTHHSTWFILHFNAFLIQSKNIVKLDDCFYKRWSTKLNIHNDLLL